MTLIELYAERAIENVLAADVFRPERIIYLSPKEVAQSKERQAVIAEFFAHRDYQPELQFLDSSLLKADKVLRQMRGIADTYPDCALDITGGTEAALFAGGMLAGEKNVPAFTYSRKRNTFYNISNAPFANELFCPLNYKVEDFFLMTGGTMRKGRVENAELKNYLGYIDDFFSVFLRYRHQWTSIVTYFQKTSQTAKGETPPMHISAPLTVKGERGSRVSANVPAMRALQTIGFLKTVKVDEEAETISYTFRDKNIRTWLRDVGSVLELYTYKACLDAKIFGNIIMSAIVDWNGEQGHDAVSNEIDVMAVNSVLPLFLSCKTCEVKTEAINELAVLRDRFGGKGAKAAIVTAEPCTAAARHRAAQMGIAIIDLEELKSEKLIHRIKVIMKASSDDMLP